MDRRTREKLQSQKKENLSVQERVKSFSIGDDKGGKIAIGGGKAIGTLGNVR